MNMALAEQTFTILETKIKESLSEQIELQSIDIDDVMLTIDCVFGGVGWITYNRVDWLLTYVDSTFFENGEIVDMKRCVISQTAIPMEE